MKNFIDLHLKQPQDIAEAEKMVSLAKELGYSAVALAVDEKTKPYKIQTEIDVITRINLENRTQKQLLEKLNDYRKKFEIIAVKCHIKEVARQAAKDHRVDILMFPGDPSQRRNVWLDYREASLASDSTCSYEISSIDLLKNGVFRSTRLLNIMKRETLNAKKGKIPVVLTSGASNIMEMREPKALTALLNLIDVSEEEAQTMITLNPQKIIQTNRMKLGIDFIETGVRRI
jgi:RNase P/RNase MRP subunit p30